MSLKTVKDVFTNPFGTARLIEGYCTLQRAKAAGIDNNQLRVLYPDLKNVADPVINGFLELGNSLVQGEIRCKGSAFPKVKRLRLPFEQQPSFESS